MYNDNQFIASLQIQKANLLEQLKHINAMLQLNGIEPDDEQSAPVFKTNEVINRPYKTSDKYTVKFAGILKEKVRFLNMNEFVNVAHSYEPNVSISELKKGLQSAKNQLLNDKVIVKIQVGTNNSNTFYGSKPWLGEDGKPLPQYMYDKNAIVTKKLIEI